MSLPVWVYDLITAVEVYEDVHGPHGDGWPCFDKSLSGVPEQQRHVARAIVAWRQASGWLPPDAQLPPVPSAAMTADAAQDGLSATLRDAESVRASVDGNTSSILPQDLSESEPPRDPSAWCWAPNPAGRLHCGRLRDHEPPHQRGERTWTSDDTTEAKP